MRYYEPLIRTETQVKTETSIRFDDDMVSDFFNKPLSAGKVLSFDESGLPLIIDYAEPVKTFDQELSELNTKYEAASESLIKEHSTARARNTDNEISKVLAAQAKIAALDLWYESKCDALIIKYFS